MDQLPVGNPIAHVQNALPSSAVVLGMMASLAARRAKVVAELAVIEQEVSCSIISRRDVHSLTNIRALGSLRYVPLTQWSSFSLDLSFLS